jgi:hypothetical protein
VPSDGCRRTLTRTLRVWLERRAGRPPGASPAYSVVITSISSISRPWPLNAAASERSERKGNRKVCFSRLKRSSSRTSVGTPSLSNARPESWVLVTIPSIRKAITLDIGAAALASISHAIAGPAFSGRFMSKRSGKSAKVIHPINQNRSLKAIICPCRAISWAIAAIVLGERKSRPCEER